MEVTFRPLLKRERDDLQGYVAWSTALFRAVLFVVAVALVGWLLRAAHALSAKLTAAFAHPAWWVVPLTLFSVALYKLSGRPTGGRAFRSKVRADLKRGEAARQRIVAVDAIEIEEQEDEGPGFFILTDDGSTMLFAGQYLDRLKTRGFPWRAFDIVEAPESNVFFRIVAAGTRLEPSGRRPPLTWEEAKTFGALNKKYRVLNVPFESLRPLSPDIPPPNTTPEAPRQARG
jgi:hypothetical protein